MSAGEAILTAVNGRVLEITLNRPDALNAIDSRVTDGLIAALAALDGDPHLTVGLLLANGRGFCSGMDLKAFAASGPPQGLERLLQVGARKPLVGAIEGFALAGGLELALLCDVLVASKGAKLGLPETRVGLVAGGGGLLRLAQRLPQGLAMELILTADPMSAEMAYERGLINRLTEPGHANRVAREIAERIAGNAPLAVAASKALVRGSQGLTEDEFWTLQRPLVASVFRSDDAKEGPRAFAQKRPPEWTGS